MLKTGRIIGILILFSFLIMCGGSTKFDKGKWDGSTYKNSQFGMTIEFPKDWHIQDDETLEAVRKMSSGVIANMSENLADAVDGSKDISAYLFMVLKEPYGAAVPVNPNILCIVEDVSVMPGLTDGSTYIYHMNKNFGGIGGGIRFNDEIGTKTIDDVVFHSVDGEIDFGNITIKNRYYVSIIDGYALSFILSYQSYEGLEKLESILSTLSFE
jgi:hypothetical protein